MLQSPELKGDTLVYTVKILQGDMPAKEQPTCQIFMNHRMF